MKFLRYIYVTFKNIEVFYPYNPYKLYRFLLKSQYWERENIENYQVNSFNRLIPIAKKTSFYESFFSDINDQINLDTIKSIPVTEKRYFQSTPKKFVTDNSDKGFFHASSGSSGKPAEVLISKEAEAFRKASVIRFRSWWGIKIHDKFVNFTAFPKASNTFSKRVKNYLSPKLDINIFLLKQENIFSIYNQILKYNPKYFRGYPSSMKQFALLLKENNINAKALNIKVIIATSEILYDSDRELMQDVFGCKVANEYGCAEGGLIAYECPKGGMHLQEESVLLFTDKNDETISTELKNDLTLLINYKIGDRIVLSKEECSCGRKLKVIERLEGRTASDTIIRPDGSALSYFFFDRMIKKMSGSDLMGKVKRFQIVQDVNDFNVYLVKGPKYDETVSTYVIDYIKEGVSDKVNVNLIFKDEIKPERSGKQRIFKRLV